MAGNGSANDPYRVGEWGAGYFLADDQGRMRIHPAGRGGPGVALSDIVRSLNERGMSDPLMIRFPQILTDRQAQIHDAFQHAIAEFDYPRHYQGVFPVKVNHDRTVVETLARSGYERRFGMEVGSKAELCLALTLEIHPEAYIVCNGFKDRDYFELAIYASKFGRRVLIIAENPQEVDDIIATSEKLGHQPLIGFRARLHSEGSGRWQESTGHKGKFGLSTIEIVEGIRRLEVAGRLEALVALHFHIGSQVCDILNLKEAIKESGRLYCAMKAKVPNLDVIDLGGGLGIDYDGSRSATDWSVNYSLDEYARDAVYLLKDICSRSDVEPPVILSESGRALTAYHAVIVLSSLRLVGGHEARDYSSFETGAHQIEDLKSTLAELKASNYREAFHDATQLLNEILLGFKLGYVGIEDRAVGECLYRDICFKVRAFMQPQHRRTKDMIALDKQLAPKLVCNFSVFMSAPDTWAVQQIFPVCPLERLDSAGKLAATIGDITCDSDGKLERFIGRGEAEPYIWLHEFNPNEPYHIGMFLVGAYQEVLGDFHNLFGTVNEGVVLVNDDDDFSVVLMDEGSSVEHSLDYFGFSPSDMVRSFDRLVDRSQGREEVQGYKGAFLRVLHGNTYLERV